MESKEPSVLGKAFRILDAFSPGRDCYTISELGERIGLPKSTTHRIVRQLVDWGALQRVGDKITIGNRLFELGTLVPLRELREVALPYMEDLHRATQEVVHLAVLDGTDTLYVEKLNSRRPFPAPSRMGGRAPAHTTSVGKVLLAYAPPEVLEQALSSQLAAQTSHTIVSRTELEAELTQVRRDGVAYDREETAEGLACLATPLFGRGHEVIAALSVMTPVERMDPTRVGPAVRLAAMAISRALDRPRTPDPAGAAPGYAEAH